MNVNVNIFLISTIYFCSEIKFIKVYRYVSKRDEKNFKIPCYNMNQEGRRIFLHPRKYPPREVWWRDGRPYFSIFLIDHHAPSTIA